MELVHTKAQCAQTKASSAENAASWQLLIVRIAADADVKTETLLGDVVVLSSVLALMSGVVVAALLMVVVPALVSSELTTTTSGCEIPISPVAAFLTPSMPLAIPATMVAVSEAETAV